MDLIMKRNLTALENYLKPVIEEINKEKNAIDSITIEDEESEEDENLTVIKNEPVEDGEERNDDN